MRQHSHSPWHTAKVFTIKMSLSSDSDFQSRTCPFFWKRRFHYITPQWTQRFYSRPVINSLSWFAISTTVKTTCRWYLLLQYFIYYRRCKGWCISARILAHGQLEISVIREFNPLAKCCNAQESQSFQCTRKRETEATTRESLRQKIAPLFR